MTYKNPRERTPLELLDGVRYLRDELRRGYRPNYVPAEEPEDGPITLGWIKYPEWLFQGIWCGIFLAEFLGAEWTRIEGYDHVEDLRSVAFYSFEEVYAWLAAYGSKERLCDGYIDEGARNGAILALAERYVQIIESNPPYIRVIEDGSGRG